MVQKLQMGEDKLPDTHVTESAERERAIAEAQGAFVMAAKLPRNETTARKALEEAIERKSFAEVAYYSFPRSGKEIYGPSVNLAREFARVWGNIISGYRIVYDPDDMRIIEAYAIDLQSNRWKKSQASFKKLHQRKDNDTGVTRWVTPNERDLRELTERHAAIQERNCILQILPRDITDEMVEKARNIAAKGIDKKDLKQARVDVVKGFEQISVSSDELDEYCQTTFGHSIDKIMPDEIAQLRGIWNSIKDGNSNKNEYFKKALPSPEEKPLEEKPNITVTEIEQTGDIAAEDQQLLQLAKQKEKEENNSQTKKSEKEWRELTKVLSYLMATDTISGRDGARITTEAMAYGKDYPKRVNHVKDELIKLKIDLTEIKEKMQIESSKGK